MKMHARIVRAWHDTFPRERWRRESIKAVAIVVVVTIVVWRWRSPRDALEYLDVSAASLATAGVIEALTLLWNFAKVPCQEANEANGRLLEENARLKADNERLRTAVARPEPPRRYTIEDQFGLALQCLRIMANRRGNAGQPAPFFFSELLKTDPALFGSPIVALDTFDWPRLRRRFTGYGVLIADEIERPFVSFGGQHFTHDFRLIVSLS